MIVWKVINNVAKLVTRIVRQAETQCIKASLKACGNNFSLESGGRFLHPEFVEIGDNVIINSHVWFSIESLGNGTSDPSLKIGKGTYIGRFTTFACVNQILIGDNVLISDRVFIADSLHGYRDIAVPIRHQALYSPGPVEIGDGTWIGIGVSILPNVRIGKNCIIGANAVVTHDVPDYHVAIGVPAKNIGRADRCRD